MTSQLVCEWMGFELRVECCCLERLRYWCSTPFALLLFVYVFFTAAEFSFSKVNYFIRSPSESEFPVSLSFCQFPFLLKHNFLCWNNSVAALFSFVKWPEVSEMAWYSHTDIDSGVWWLNCCDKTKIHWLMLLKSADFSTLLIEGFKISSCRLILSKHVTLTSVLEVRRWTASKNELIG